MANSEELIIFTSHGEDTLKMAKSFEGPLPNSPVLRDRMLTVGVDEFLGPRVLYLRSSYEVPCGHYSNYQRMTDNVVWCEDCSQHYEVVDGAWFDEGTEQQEGNTLYWMEFDELCRFLSLDVKKGNYVYGVWGFRKNGPNQSLIFLDRGHRNLR